MKFSRSLELDLINILNLSSLRTNNMKNKKSTQVPVCKKKKKCNHFQAPTPNPNGPNAKYLPSVWPRIETRPRIVDRGIPVDQGRVSGVQRPDFEASYHPETNWLHSQQSPKIHFRDNHLHFFMRFLCKTTKPTLNLTFQIVYNLDFSFCSLSKFHNPRNSCTILG